MINICNLSATVTGNKNAGASLTSISTTLPDCGLVALTGDSVADRELFLAVLAGLVPPTSGTVSYDGLLLYDMPEAKRDVIRATKVAYVTRDENLFPSATAAENVRYALNLAKVPGNKIASRCKEAFAFAGVEGMEKTKASALTREQVVRVCIARSYAAGQSVVLLTEPLDGLDEAASARIMTLLTQLAEDRLVVFTVQKKRIFSNFAGRILNLRFGELFELTEKNVDASIVSAAPLSVSEMRASAKRPSHSRALRNSANVSLRAMTSRKARTFGLCFAGIILFMLVAIILSFRTGTLDFVKNSETGSLSSYPVVATNNGALLQKAASGLSGDSSISDGLNSNGSSVSATETLQGFLGNNIGKDNLAQLKSEIESKTGDIAKNAGVVEYDYDVTPMIYLPDTSKGLYQVNPGTAIALLYRFSTVNAQGTSNILDTDCFNKLPVNDELYQENFNIVAGSWPKEPTDIVVLLNADGTMDEYLSYLLGINDYNDLVSKVNSALCGEEATLPSGSSHYNASDLMDRTFKLVMKSDCYVKDKTTGTWSNYSYNQAFMKELVAEGTTLKVCGVVQPKWGTAASSSSSGLCYSSQLETLMSDYNNNSQIVKEQKENPEVNVLTGKTFEEEQNGTTDEDAADIGKKALALLLGVDESALDEGNLSLSSLTSSEEFRNFISVLSMDPSTIDTSDFNLDNLPLPNLKTVLTLSEIEKTEIHSELISQVLYEEIITYFEIWAKAAEKGQSPPSIEQYWESETAQKIFNKLTTGLVDTSKISSDSAQKVQDYLTGYLSNELSPYLLNKAGACVGAVIDAVKNHAVNVVVPYVKGRVSALVSDAERQMISQLSVALGIDLESLTDESALNLRGNLATSLVSSLFDMTKKGYAGNLSAFGYLDLNRPVSISFYQSTLEAKYELKASLDAYNQKQVDRGKEDLKVNYFDLAGSVADVTSEAIVQVTNMLLLLLVIFLLFGVVAINLGMRATVFQYRMQASILRRLGGSKAYVFFMFLIEAMTIGLIFSCLGILASALICEPVGSLVRNSTGLSIGFYLNWSTMVAMVAAGVLVAFIGGLGPALEAAKGDSSKHAF